MKEIMGEQLVAIHAGAVSYTHLAQVREERFAYASLTWLSGKVCKKALKGKDAVTIANELEEDDVGKVQRIMDVAKSFAPDYDVEEIYKKLME